MLSIRKIFCLSGVIGMVGYVTLAIHQHGIQVPTFIATSTSYNPTMRDESDSVQPSSVELKKVIADLKSQERRLNQHQRELKRILTRLDASKRVASAANNLENDEHYVESEMESKHIQRANELETAFANELIDEEWSSVAIEQVSTILTQFDTVALLDLDCQSTFCRINLEYDGTSDLETFLDSFIFDLGWETNSYIQNSIHENNDMATVVYLSREGYHLPFTDESS